MIDVIFVASSAEGDHLIVSPVRELYLDIGLFLFLVRIHRGHIWDWGPSGNGSPLAFQVLEPFRWAFCVPTHDWNEKQSRLQKKLLERTLGRRSLDPIERVAQYLCFEQNLDPCSSWLDSYLDAPAIERREVANQRKFAYCKHNAQKVRVVLLTKCPEPFAGVGYE